MRLLLLVAFVLLLAAPAQAALTVLDLDTGRRTTLVRHEPSEGWASLRWTADGRALIGVANDELDLSVRRYPLKGGHARVLRKLPDALDAVLSPGGTRVAALYESGLGGTGGVIVRDVASGRGRARLPQTAEGDELYEDDVDVVWSPDGRRIAYRGRERRRETVRVADARSGRVLRRVTAERYADLLGFSPSGDRVLYTGGTYGRLSVLTVASGDSHRLADTALTADWAPAGERIAASTGETVTVTGEDQRVASTTPTDPAADTVLWSPDGTTLALILRGEDYRKATLALLTPGGRLRKLDTSRRIGFRNLQWSPDGRHLAFAG